MGVWSAALARPANPAASSSSTVSLSFDFDEEVRQFLGNDDPEPAAKASKPVADLSAAEVARVVADGSVRPDPAPLFIRCPLCKLLRIEYSLLFKLMCIEYSPVDCFARNSQSTNLY